MAALRVLLVDDHDLFRIGLRELLEGEGYEVADASGAAAAVRLCRSFRPQVVVLDVNMPGTSGIEAIGPVLDAQPEAAILMLTVAADDERVLDAVRAGASGYLLKDARLDEIVAGVEAAAAGRSPIAPRVAGALFASVRERRAEPRPPDAPVLTERERAVLALLAHGRDNGEIARKLFISPSTVKNHISSVLLKLGLENRVQAATYAVRHGLAEEPASPALGREPRAAERDELLVRARQP